eukprot:CAMPEP_0195288728 /NCGR_PEP_ID=MMETSP0707-20130614/5273_1 /TAXON_ID=33640 /ORGANISM="Asterionellopsis glacialis, Strain CCMP134" /LENGTH=1602 /DNA_ID=CAMNT_0040348627 /DNA_START=32 /DNA_END=4840 /DNA_ORIENTATION=+
MAGIPNPKGTDSKRVERVHLYLPKFSAGTKKARLRLYHIIFIIIYIYHVIWVSSTVGEPYRKFLEKADREGFQVMEGATKMRAELEFSMGDIDDPNRHTKKVGWFDWMDADIEELAERKKREKEKTVLDSLPKSMRVPKRYAPAFTPMLCFGIAVVLHALIMLMQHWSVAFLVWINYKEVDAENVNVPKEMLELNMEDEDEEGGSGDVKKKTNKKQTGGDDSATLFLRAVENVPSYLPSHARIVPAKGKDVLVTIEYLPTIGMTFEYHRRRYAYHAETSTWTKIRCRTNLPLDFFESWTGFSSFDQLISGQIRYGPNMFDVKKPTFKEMYKAQLLSPLTVFQLFCVILWMLDDYWQYSFFTLFMILSFEATVVFSRLKSLQALTGMGNKSRPVFVHRSGKWTSVESHALLPGDIMSLHLVKPHYAKNENDDKSKKLLAKKLRSLEDEGGDVVPADLLLLRGSTVVNEASLTGESVPQMKEGLVELEENENLSMTGKHKNNVMYAGTRMLQCKGHAEGVANLYGDISNPPDDGCLCFVLRTGFSSAQGKLVRMIEGSQEKVKGHEKDTGLLLLLLFVFAVASSSYVLYHGLRDENRSQYELLLHCILIITSVIPPELPMQMALAVNNSIMTLMKMQVFCTEPYRVPIAGKLDACLFDKTGTLTTDELVAVGVCESSKLSKFQKGASGVSSDAGAKDIMTPMTKIANEAGLVLAGCHSLINVDGETTGDPLESASLAAMRWRVAPGTAHIVPAEATEKKIEGKKISIPQSAPTSELQILIRHHFSSKLQRMSCVVRDVTNNRHYAVAKGSPEAIGKLLASKPDGYDEMSHYLSKEGYRVIALAYKKLDSKSDVEGAKDARAKCEAGLTCAGVIAFTCRVRKDTALVLRKLKEGGMSVAMVTGDALLTACHVAKEVDIIDAIGENGDDNTTLDDPLADITNPELREFLASKQPGNSRFKDGEKKRKEYKPILILKQSKSSMHWHSYDDDSKVDEFTASEVPELSKQYDLAITGKDLAAAFEFDEETKKVLGYFKVFARMTPDAKETVIECLHSVGSLCLMCGDGANDVGALKQADVGVALLSGFGDVNVDKGEDGIKKKDKESSAVNVPPASAIIPRDKLAALRSLPVSLLKVQVRSLGIEPNKYPQIVEKEDLIKLYQIKARELAIKAQDKKLAKSKLNMTKSELAAEKRVLAQEKQKKMMERAAELEAQGETWATFKAAKEFMAAEAAEAKKNKAAMSQGRGIEGSAAAFAAQLEDMESGDLPMVKIGDASIAAPFTSKMPSIKSCVDIIRQGRCTLVSSIQMYQILALNCLISSYSLSVLYLDGVKYGDTQMTATGMLMSISFMSVSRSKPLERLSSVRPLTSIFHPSLFLSLLIQFSIHLTTMYIAVRAAKQHLPEDYKVDLDGVFKPGIVNSVVFLVSNVQQVTVFVVNLQGRPFMTGLTENRPLLWSLVATFILTFMFASESLPGLNKYFQLVPFPDEAFRNFILTILAIDVFATFTLDRLMKFIFCPHILFASVKGTSLKDALSLSRTIAVIAFVMYTFLGNDDQWEELMQEEGRLEELGLVNETDGNVTETVAKVVETVAKACVGADCEGSELNDEF